MSKRVGQEELSAGAGVASSPAKKLRALRLRRRRLIAVGTVTAVLVATGGGVAYAMTRTEGGDYRTALAALGSVSESLDLVGTLASATRSDASFSVAGTVSDVAVSLRDTVSAGQTLATLDVSSLNDAIDAAQAKVSSAQVTLESDLDSQTTTTATTTDASASSASAAASVASTSITPATITPATTGTTGTTQGSTPGATGETSAAVTDAVKAVGAAQAALLAQYGTAVTALAATQDAIDSTTDVCLPFLEAALEEVAGDDTTADEDAADSAETATAGATEGTTEAATEEDSDATTETPAAPLTAAEKFAAAKLALADCQSAITAVLAGQTTTNEAQANVLTLVDDLNQAVAALQEAAAVNGSAASGADSSADSSAASNATPDAAATIPTSSATAPTAASSTTGGAATSAPAVSGTSGTGGAGGTATVASAETILADQAEIDAAVAELAIAERNLTLATLTSPIAGTLAAVDLAVGDTVAASSATAVITIIGEDGFVVSTTVSLTHIVGVAVGQNATINVASVDDELAGIVSSIGILNVSTSSTPSYTLQIALESTDSALLNGASAAITVAVASLDEVLTVPTSAVHLADSTYSVDLLVNGLSKNAEDTVGAVGSELTEIRSGITVGDTVILADLNASIATADTGTDTGLSGLGGDATTQTDTRPEGGAGPPAR
jgi:multidrug resistance efflux pump